MTDANLSDVAAAGARTLWLVFEAAEVIELKRILLDRDAEGTEAFFQRVVSPRVRAAARQRGSATDLLAEEGDDEASTWITRLRVGPSRRRSTAP